VDVASADDLARASSLSADIDRLCSCYFWNKVLNCQVCMSQGNLFPDGHVKQRFIGEGIRLLHGGNFRQIRPEIDRLKTGYSANPKVEFFRPPPAKFSCFN
jgi:hypothetical protein